MHDLAFTWKAKEMRDLGTMRSQVLWIIEGGWRVPLARAERERERDMLG